MQGTEPCNCRMPECSYAGLAKLPKMQCLQLASSAVGKPSAAVVFLFGLSSAATCDLAFVSLHSNQLQNSSHMQPLPMKNHMSELQHSLQP